MGEVVKVDSKGRIVIPKQIRDRLGIHEGTQFTIEVTHDHITLSRVSFEDVDHSDPCTRDQLRSFLADNELSVLHI